MAEETTREQTVGAFTGAARDVVGPVAEQVAAYAREEGPRLLKHLARVILTALLEALDEDREDPEPGGESPQDDGEADEGDSEPQAEDDSEAEDADGPEDEAAEEPDDDEPDEDEDESADEDDSAEDDTDDAEADDDGEYTWEELEGMDRAELRGVIRDQDLDIKAARQKTDRLRERIAEALDIEVP